MKHWKLVAVTMMMLLGTQPGHADVTLSKVFGDHMVLQQEMPIRIFGWASPGEEVTAELAGKTATATADKAGRFRVELPAMKASAKPQTLTVSGKNKVTLKDILIGEVWICSGQSNMEWPVGASKNAQEEIKNSTNPNIRLFNVNGHVSSPVPLTDPRGSWQLCSPKTVGGFTAVGYFFGRELQKDLDVPIGLIGTNWGGTRIEPWTPKVGFEQVDNLKDYLDTLNAVDPSTPQGKKNNRNYLTQVEKWLETAKQKHAAGEPIGAPPQRKFSPKGGATSLYNGMVHALIPLSVRGAIWYQGESNAGNGLRYEFMKEALVKGWRKVFENEDLSFYWVQLANFQQPSKNPAGGGWGNVREGQRRALRLPKTGMAVTIDIGEANDIHPRNKQDVGKRLALWALANDYGKKIVYSGPLYKDMKVDDNKVILSFDHVGGGLMVGKKEGLAPTQEVSGSDLTQFSIQDANGKWHWAKAKIEGANVVVWAEGVAKPRNVRFGYQSNPSDINLYNKEGLPASPFTTEKPAK